MADALSRTPAVDFITNQNCTWYCKLIKNVRCKPKKFPDYAIHNQHLYRRVLHDLEFRDHTEDECWKVCVPRGERETIIRRLHDESTAGHLGVSKTIFRVTRSYHWSGMYRNIARYVQNCRNCQTHKQHQPVKARRPFSRPSRLLSLAAGHDRPDKAATSIRQRIRMAVRSPGPVYQIGEIASLAPGHQHGHLPDHMRASHPPPRMSARDHFRQRPAVYLQAVP